MGFLVDRGCRCAWILINAVDPVCQCGDVTQNVLNSRPNDVLIAFDRIVLSCQRALLERLYGWSWLSRIFEGGIVKSQVESIPRLDLTVDLNQECIWHEDLFGSRLLTYDYIQNYSLLFKGSCKSWDIKLLEQYRQITPAALTVHALSGQSLNLAPYF